MATQKTKSYTLDLCSERMLPTMLKFALPLMFSSLLQLLFNAADIIVVGRYAGDNSLAAVGSNSALIQLLVNLFIGLSVGSSILASRQFGARDTEGVRQTVHTSILLALLSGIGLAIAGVFSARTFLVWMQAPPEVLDLATAYLQIYFLGMPASMLYNFGAALLRAVGDTRRPLYYLTIAGVVNVVLNLFFVIALDMDVVGVGLATVISQCISAFFILRCMMRDTGAIHLEWKQLRLYGPRMRQILYIGLPAGFQGIMFSLSNVVIQSSVNSFGEITMAGNTAAANLDSFIYAAINAFYQTAMSFTSQNLGAGKIERIRPIYLRSAGCAIVFSLVLGCGTTLLGPWLLQIYSKSPVVIEAGMLRLTIVCVPYFLCALMEVTVGMLRGIGYSVLPMLVTLLGACGFRLVWLATVFQIPQYHATTTIYSSYPISWTLTFLSHFFCFLWAMRHLRKKMAGDGHFLP